MSEQTTRDISSCCAFTYADTRHCRMPRAAKSNYCEYHRRRLLPLQSSREVTASLYEPIGQSFVPVTGHPIPRASMPVSPRVPSKQKTPSP